MLYLILAAVIAAADQLTKYLTNANIELHGGFSLIPGLLGITNERNTGMAWSMLAGSELRWLLGVISVVVSIALVAVILLLRLSKGEKLALAFVLGGAVGNAIDRLAFGYVTDMIKTEFISFPIFNVADSFITVGAILFVILYGIRAVKEERAQKSLAMPELKRLREAAKKREEDGSDEEKGDK